MIWFIAMSIFVGYVVIAFMVRHIILNETVMIEFKKRLNELKRSSEHMQEWECNYHKVDSIEEAALDQVKSYTMVYEDANFSAIFWPFWGLWKAMYFKLRNSKINIIPKNSVEKLIEDKRKNLKDIEELEVTLRTLKSTGIDTSLIKEIIKEKKSAI